MPSLPKVHSWNKMNWNKFKFWTKSPVAKSNVEKIIVVCDNCTRQLDLKGVPIKTFNETLNVLATLDGKYAHRVCCTCAKASVR